MAQRARGPPKPRPGFVLLNISGEGLNRGTGSKNDAHPAQLTLGPSSQHLRPRPRSPAAAPPQYGAAEKSPHPNASDSESTVYPSARPRGRQIPPTRRAGRGGEETYRRVRTPRRLCSAWERGAGARMCVGWKARAGKGCAWKTCAGLGGHRAGVAAHARFAPNGAASPGSWAQARAGAPAWRGWWCAMAGIPAGRRPAMGGPALLLLVLCAAGARGLYFHIGETEKRCFIEEIPDETMVIGQAGRGWTGPFRSRRRGRGAPRSVGTERTRRVVTAVSIPQGTTAPRCGINRRRSSCPRPPAWACT